MCECVGGGGDMLDKENCVRGWVGDSQCHATAYLEATNKEWLTVSEHSHSILEISLRKQGV